MSSLSYERVCLGDFENEGGITLYFIQPLNCRLMQLNQRISSQLDMKMKLNVQ